MPSTHDFTFLTRAQVAYLARLVFTSVKERAAQAVAATPSRIDDMVYGLAERTILSDENFEKVLDLVLNKLGI